MSDEFGHSLRRQDSQSTDRLKNTPNRLINEKSPYLLQHAYNPVDWRSWGDEAFETARIQNKPIFLSIGYSTCHWCHVMERESFEDDEVAAIMNRVFVSIKVDREERPDIDHTYMTVCQMMTGSGGWALNIVMTPDKKPFFAGTYFPKNSRYGRIGLVDLATRIEGLWINDRAQIYEASEKLLSALNTISQNTSGEPLGEDSLKIAYQQLAQRFDPNFGGFSEAPKFPTPHNLVFLLRHWKRTGDTHSLQMATKTLDQMRLGGIYDHVGFGFHRYSTDAQWLVPHFEKMLYDQAMLAMAYTEAYEATKRDDYKNTVQEIMEYVLRDLTSPEGGFYSAEDADSEGEEGKFYVWTEEELKAILSKNEANFVEKAFNVYKMGNFKEEASQSLTGRNILYLKRPLRQLREQFNLSEIEIQHFWEKVRLQLFEIREKRPHPHKDDKILTDWNGLMIAALAKASRVFDNKDYANAAIRAADFVLTNLRDTNGKLLRRYRLGEAGLSAHVDDYAFLIWGLLELYETTFATNYLNIAIELNQDFSSRFWDSTAGGFFFTAEDSEELLLRQKEIYDGATPSGNSVAAMNLIRLHRVTGSVELDPLIWSISRAFSKIVTQFPSGYTQFLLFIDFLVGPSFEIVVAGPANQTETQSLLRRLNETYCPNKVVILKSTGEEADRILSLAPFTSDMGMIDGSPTAYVCGNFSCMPPTTDPEKMLSLLKTN
ncbi:MAG: thioredoxin domain-containing protein [Desulfomonilaceae bacterium]